MTYGEEMFARESDPSMGYSYLQCQGLAYLLYDPVHNAEIMQSLYIGFNIEFYGRLQLQNGYASTFCHNVHAGFHLTLEKLYMRWLCRAGRDRGHVTKCFL